MHIKNILLTVGLVAVANSAQAFSVNVAAFTTPILGSTEINFDDALPPLELVSGGAIYSASVPGLVAKPIDSLNNFYAVGAGQNQQSPGIFNLGGAVNYFSFLWGSVDTRNTVNLFNDGNQVFSFNGNGFIPNNGDQSKSIYVNIFGGDNDVFDEIRFSSNGIAFEIDHVNYGTVEVPAEVPVPAALPLMASALAFFGFSAKKRKKVKV